MGVTKLEISSDLSALIGKVDELNGSVKKLTGETDNYNQRSTAGFQNTAQSAKALNAEIKAQEKIIKDMEREAEKMSKATGRRAQENQQDYKRLQGDIKVAKQELQNLNKQQEQVQTTASKGMDIFKKFGAVMAATFTAGAIVKFSKEVIMSTDATSDAFKEFTEGARQGLAVLYRSIATLDFTDIIKSLKEAYSEGVRYAKILDIIQNRKRSVDIQKLEIEGQIIDLKTLARQRWGDIHDREMYVDQIIELEKKKLEISKTLTQEVLNNELANAAQISGLREDEVKDIISNFDLYRERIDEGTKLQNDLEALKTASANKTVTRTGFIITDTKKYDEAVANLTDTQKENLRIAEAMNKLTDDAGGKREAIAKAIQDDIKATNEEKQGLQSLGRMRNMIYNELEALAKKETKTVEDANKIKWNSWAAYVNDLQEWIHVLSKEVDGAEINFNEILDPTNPENDAWIDGLLKVQKKSKETFDAELKRLNEYHKMALIDEEEYAEAIEDLNKRIENARSFAEKNPFWSSLGIENEEQLSQIKDYVGQLTDFANQMIDQQVQATERIVEDQNQRIDEQQQLVEREYADKEAGLANSYELESENLKKMQKARDEAIKDRERMIKIQRIMSTTESGIALVSAAANIIKGFSSIPVVGVVLGLAAVAAMVAGFLLMSSKAKDATKMERGGLLEGRRHTQGGIPMEAEDGEFFINRNSTKKHLPLLEAINRDDREGMKLYFDRNFITKFPQSRQGKDYSKDIGNVVKELKKGKPETIYGPGYRIEKSGGYTKIIHLN
jgi:hypothetical protein